MRTGVREKRDWVKTGEEKVAVGASGVEPATAHQNLWLRPVKCFFRHRTNINLSFAPELIQINKQRSSWRVTYNVTKLIEKKPTLSEGRGANGSARMASNGGCFSAIIVQRHHCNDTFDDHFVRSFHGHCCRCSTDPVLESSGSSANLPLLCLGD